MNPDYFKTRFRTDEKGVQFPDEFVIITAHPTTGEKWKYSRILDAENQLLEELKSRKCWMHSLEGYSPVSGHAEPGWAIVMPLDEARDLGLSYKQDAIFHVRKDLLSVTYCDHRRGLVNIDSFKARLDLSQSDFPRFHTPIFTNITQCLSPYSKS